MGYVLMQLHADGQYKLIEAGSRWLTPAEQNYGMTSLELAAVNWAVEKCKPYLLGLPFFEIVTDHQALVSMLNTKTLDEIENPRQLSRLFFGGKTGGKIRKISSREKLLSEEEEEPGTENMLRISRSNPSLCKPLELEDAILTVEGEPLTKRSGSVQTIKDTEELFREMTPNRKKIKIIVESGDLDQEDLNMSNKKLISPTDSFEEDVIPVGVVPILPSSSFGKNIRHDLTGYEASSTPFSGDR